MDAAEILYFQALFSLFDGAKVLQKAPQSTSARPLRASQNPLGFYLGWALLLFASTRQ